MPQTETHHSHKQLRHMVADRLRDAINDGEFIPGEWLRQERLARELGVSQKPVREALKELAAEGLVEHIPYRGVRLVEFTSDDVMDLYAHRSFLESRAACIAAQLISPVEIAELRSLQAKIEAHLASNHLVDYRELNRKFHQVIFTASRHDYLIRTLNQVWVIFATVLWGNFARTATGLLPEWDINDKAEHNAIIAALEARDCEAAEQLVRNHIESAGSQLLKTLKAGQG